MLALAFLLAAAEPAAVPAAAATSVVTESGIVVETLEPGTGRRPSLEDAVLVTYEGRLADGTVFDSTTEPVGMRVADAVDGFTEALLLMNQGGRYRFTLPPRLAYGRRGIPGVVPPDAELTFTLTLVRVGRPAQR